MRVTLLILLSLVLGGTALAAHARSGEAAPSAALLEARYAELDARLNRLQAEFERDPSTEAALFEAFKSLSKSRTQRERIEANFDAWIALFPESYAARLARGLYRLERGLEARGDDYISKTAAQNLAEMNRWLVLARPDLQASLRLNAKPLLSRIALLKVAMRTGTRREIDAHYEAAISYAPRSLRLRTTYLYSLEPRWGGSRQAMIRYLEQTRSELGEGPEFRRLQAILAEDEGDAQSKREQFDKAHEAYSKAIALDDRPYYRCVRAFVAIKREKRDEAIADMRAALTGHPPAPYCTETMAWIVEHDNDLPGAFELVDGFVRQDPDNARLLKQRGWLYQQRGEMARAYTDYAHAAESGDAWAQTMAGKYLFNGWGGEVDRERGLALLKQAAEQGDINAQTSVIQALRTMGREEEAQVAQKTYAAIPPQRSSTSAPPQPSWLDWLDEGTTRLSLVGMIVGLIILWIALRYQRARQASVGAQAEQIADEVRKSLPPLEAQQLTPSPPDLTRRYQVGMTWYALIGWLCMLFFGSAVIMSWRAGATSVAPLFLGFMLLGAYLCVSAGRIVLDVEQIEVTNLLSVFRMVWREVEWIEVGPQGTLVLQGNNKRLVLTSVATWTGKDKPQAFRFLGHQIEQLGIAVIPGNFADYKINKNVLLCRRWSTPPVRT